jgi:TPR repeat protein
MSLFPRRFALAALGIVMLSAHAAFAGLEVETAEGLIKQAEHYEKGDNGSPDPAKAAACYEKAATLGSAEAMNRLGLCFISGSGVSLDASKAYSLFQQAASKGYAKAYYNIGLCCRDGIGTSKDIDGSVKAFRKGSELGSVEATTGLAALMIAGKGMPEDVTGGEALLVKAANSGSADAMCKLGDLYQRGEGSIPVDHQKARSWYAKSAALGNKDAAASLKDLAKELAQKSASDAGLNASKHVSGSYVPPSSGRPYNAKAYMGEQYVGAVASRTPAPPITPINTVDQTTQPPMPPRSIQPLQESQPAQQNSSESDLNEVKAFFVQYLHSMLSNDPSQVADFFGQTVDYCYGNGGPSTPLDIAEDNRKLIAKYPERTYSDIHVVSIQSLAPGEAEIDYTFHYSYRGKKHASGSSEVVLRLRRVAEGWKIVAFHEQVQRAQAQESAEVSSPASPEVKPDVANVFWNPARTLRCLRCNRKIHPVRTIEGYEIYQIWYSSNEDPTVHFLNIAKSNLPGFTYYKFCSQACCAQWVGEHAPR